MNIHVVLELLQVSLLLSQLLLELQQLLLLALADRKVFVGLFALLEGVTSCNEKLMVSKVLSFLKRVSRCPCAWDRPVVAV